VLAAVTAGIYLGWRSPEIASPESRIQGFAVWELLMFLLNAVLFILVGLQVNVVLDALGGYSVGSLIGYAAAVCAMVVGLRLAWGFTVVYLVRAIDRKRRVLTRRTSAAQRFVAGWAGMRGAVSLAAALAIPFHTDAGAPFPQRELIIFLTVAVILVTLVGQGLMLPTVIRVLGLAHAGRREREADKAEECDARRQAAIAALNRLNELAASGTFSEDILGPIRIRQRHRLEHIEHGNELDERNRNFRDLHDEIEFLLIATERRHINEQYRRGVLTDVSRRRIERELDLREAQLLNQRTEE
jgi:CPA1 family monovalent cation:H+ antiporter